ncbi:g2821 [Coccomyxa viridis]|uniref:G2821 protein n=1 Tax=Coccomyxa viridis TaxID=1274662 RepID=A0ABP1FLB8_9CHLO
MPRGTAREAGAGIRPPEDPRSGRNAREQAPGFQKAEQFQAELKGELAKMKRMVAEIEGEHGVDKERVAAVRSQYTSVQNAVNGLIVDIEIVKATFPDENLLNVFADKVNTPDSAQRQAEDLAGGPQDFIMANPLDLIIPPLAAEGLSAISSPPEEAPKPQETEGLSEAFPDQASSLRVMLTTSQGSAVMHAYYEVIH